MFVYLKNKYDTTMSAIPSKHHQFEILNELKDISNRRSDNLLKRTRYLFEDDYSTLDEQLKVAMKLYNDGIVQRIVYSGGKSYHCIIETDYDANDDEEYKAIWHYMNDRFFNGKCDKACSNANRLTRAPNAMRDNVKQELIIDSKQIVSISNTTLNAIRSKMIEKQLQSAHFEPISGIKRLLNQQKCSKFAIVQKYLNTPYIKLNGNGTSSSELWASVCACIKYGDDATMQLLMNKAKREHWSDTELTRMINNAQKAVHRS